MDTNRISWDEYFFNITKEVAKRSPCLKTKVGAIIVGNDNNILSTGYNGPVRGAYHCVECQRINTKSGINYDKCPAVHAEVNAIVRAAKYGIKIWGSTIYITRCPCYTCAKQIINSGIRSVLIPFDNIIPKVVNFMEKNGVYVGIMK